MNHRPIIHRTQVVIKHNNPGKAISIDEFIESERGDMTADRLRGLGAFSVQIFAKLATDQARQHHDLHEGTHCLMRLLASEEVACCADPLPPRLAEAGVALAYLLKGMDLIPDSVPEIGLTDDARIVARVIDRNPELRS